MSDDKPIILEGHMRLNGMAITGMGSMSIKPKREGVIGVAENVRMINCGLEATIRPKGKMNHYIKSKKSRVRRKYKKKFCRLLCIPISVMMSNG